MAIEVPEWLKQHNGDLKLASDHRTWYVVIHGKPLYTVCERPVSGKFGSVIRQSNNGKLIDSSSTSTDANGAMAAGLEDLRKYLGW